jgi:hypothetical protein
MWFVCLFLLYYRSLPLIYFCKFMCYMTILHGKWLKNIRKIIVFFRSDYILYATIEFNTENDDTVNTVSYGDDCD